MNSWFRNSGEVGLLALGACLGLFLPDIDLVLLFLLHHRSMVTHSLLIPFLIRRWIPKPLFFGLLCGISIHLFADSLGSMRGFGAIHIPITRQSIGAGGSMIWLLANATMSLVLLVSSYRRVFWVCLVAYLIVAILYGVFNEGAEFLAYALAAFGFIATLWAAVSRSPKEQARSKDSPKTTDEAIPLKKRMSASLTKIVLYIFDKLVLLVTSFATVAVVSWLFVEFF